MSLKSFGYLVEFAKDADDVLRLLRNRSTPVDAVLIDLVIAKREGFDALVEIRHTEPAMPVIVVSSDCLTSVDITRARQSGATDFLTRPIEQDALRRTLEQAVYARPALPPQDVSPSPQKPRGFIGTAASMREIQAITRKVGSSGEPVLIQGETGSGKEVLARELHRQSSRASKPFLKLNCAALPSELVESELFGYEKGAFTGAFQKKLGMFEMANGGTILLDEIGDMDVKLQAKLLQVLQDQEFHRIGGTETIRVDVRVIAATHRDLEKAIAEKAFREDLYYRINVLTLYLPPLRERQEDILALAEFLWKKHAGVEPLLMTPALRQVFLSYEWPGNIRELENTIRKLMVLRDPEIVAGDLLAKIARKQNGTAAHPASAGNHADRPPVTGPTILEEVSKAKQQAEVEAILSVLNATRWNRKQAAALLKVDYKALLYKMKKLGIDDNVVAIAPHNPRNGRSLAATGSD
jgi:two-component system response regulator AtoC